MTLYSSILETLYSLAGTITPYTAWSVFREIKKGGALSRDELEALQWQRLSALLQFAYDNVSLYRDFWGRNGIHPKDIKNKNDFCKLPVLTRAKIAAGVQDDLLCRGGDTGKLASVCSSGTTTGKPLRVFIDNACYNHQYANLLYGYYLSGWRLGMPMMTVRNYAHGDYQGKYSSGEYRQEPCEALRSIIYRCVHRKQLLPPLQGGMKPDEAYLDSIYKRIKAYSPYLLEGNSYFWYVFSKHLLERGESLPSVKGVEIDEVCLASGQRKIIAQCFNCPVYDCYGSHELGVVAHGCPAQEGNHILSLSHCVEILDERSGQAALPGATGSVIITDISNRAMPLIRYETGDLASMPANPCSCGSSYPLMSSVAGRTINSVAFADRLFTEEFFLDRILCFDGVAAFQVDKSAPGVLAVSLIAKAPGLRETIEEDLKKATGMPVHVSLVENIPLERPGKARWVRS